MSAPHVRLAAILGLLAFAFGASPASGTAAPHGQEGRPLIGSPPGDKLHVMSTNIRTYDSIGIGSEGGSNGQFIQIFFDSTRLDPLQFDHFWLSGKPSELGSTTWGNDEFMRMATWVRFLDRRTDQEFYHLNTHFDHRRKRAGERSAELVKERIKDFQNGAPVVVTGDFNARAENSGTYDILTTGKGALKNAWRTAEKRVTPAYGTFPNYGPPKVGGRRIDWILTRGMIVRSIGHNGFRVKGNYPSDHLPVQAVLAFKP